MTHRFFNLTLLHCTHSKSLVIQLTIPPTRMQLNVIQGLCLLAIACRSHTQLRYSSRYACTVFCINGQLLQWSNAPLSTAYILQHRTKNYYKRLIGMKWPLPIWRYNTSISAGTKENMNLGRGMDIKMHGNSRIGRLLRASLDFD